MSYGGEWVDSPWPSPMESAGWGTRTPYWGCSCGESRNYATSTNCIRCHSDAPYKVFVNAKRMAKDVDKALHDIAATQGGLSEEGAVAFVKQLKKDKRYQRDVY